SQFQYTYFHINPPEDLLTPVTHFDNALYPIPVLRLASAIELYTSRISPEPLYCATFLVLLTVPKMDCGFIFKLDDSPTYRRQINPPELLRLPLTALLIAE